MADESKSSFDWSKAASTVGDIAGLVTGVGAIGSGISAIGNMLGFGNTAKKQAEQQMQMQKELIDYNYDKQVEQWNRENAYNSPQSQLERLKQAGLNPLFRDLDGNSAGGLSSVNSPAAPNMAEMQNAFAASRKMQFDQLMQAKQVQQMNKAMEVQDSEIDLNSAQAELARSNAKGRNIMNERDAIALWYDQQKQAYDKIPVFARDENGDIMYGDDGKPLMTTINDQKLLREFNAINQAVQMNSKQLESMGYDNVMKKLDSDHYEQKLLTELEKLGYDRDLAKVAIRLNNAQISLAAAQEEHEKAAAKKELALAQEAFAMAVLGKEEAKNQKYVRGNLAANTRLQNEERQNVKEERKHIIAQGKKVAADADAQELENKRDHDLYGWNVAVKCLQDVQDIAFGFMDLRRVFMGTNDSRTRTENDSQRTKNDNQRTQNDSSRTKNNNRNNSVRTNNDSRRTDKYVNGSGSGRKSNWNR